MKNNPQLGDYVEWHQILPMLIKALERDPKGRAKLAQLIGAVAPKGDEGPQGERGPEGPRGESGKDGRDGAPGTTWLPVFALEEQPTGEVYMTIVDWLEWPSNKKPPPTGYVGDSNSAMSFPDMESAQRFIDTNGAEYLVKLLNRGGGNAV